MKLTASTMNTRNPAPPAKTHGKVVAIREPSAMTVPRETSGERMPKPKNDRLVSAMTAAAIASVASMINSDATLGRMWRTMIVGPRTPMYLAAVTYSRSRTDIVKLRAIRADSIQLRNISQNASQMARLELMLRMNKAMIRKAGSTSNRSMVQSETRSNHPPKYAANDPTIAAIVVAPRPTTRLISIDTRRPCRLI